MKARLPGIDHRKKNQETTLDRGEADASAMPIFTKFFMELEISL